MTRPESQHRHPLAQVIDGWETRVLALRESAREAEESGDHLAARTYWGRAAELSDCMRALRAQAETAAVEPWQTIPQEIAQMVVATGRAEWADTEAQDAQGHGAAMTRSVQITAENFGQTEPQAMQLLVIEGTDTVLGYMGTSPNSPVIARAMTGAWNWLHEQSAHALAQAGGDL